MYSETSPSEEEKERKAVTPDKVEKYFSVAGKLKRATRLEQVVELCREYGIEIPEHETEADLIQNKKALLDSYLAVNFPHSNSPEEHEGKIARTIERLVSLLSERKSRLTIWVGGSYGTGRVRSTITDIDLFVGIPKFDDPNERAQEIEILARLKDIGIITSRIDEPKDVEHVMESGRGLARLSAMTTEGVGVDFHGLGIDDLKSIHKLVPGFITRIRQVEAYKETITSFTGSKEYLLKPGKDIFHFKKVDDEMFKGFYLLGVNNLVQRGDIFTPYGTNKISAALRP